MLRGANVNGLNDIRLHGTGLRRSRRWTDGLRSHGGARIDVVRLNIGGRRSNRPPAPSTPLRPPDPRGRAGLEDNGIYTVIDMHQDAWGPYVGTPRTGLPAASCSAGSGGTGHPNGPTLTAGGRRVQHRRSAGSVAASPGRFQAFYDDEQGVQGHWCRPGRAWPQSSGTSRRGGLRPDQRTRTRASGPVRGGRSDRRFYQAIAGHPAGREGGFPHLVDLRAQLAVVGVRTPRRALPAALSCRSAGRVLAAPLQPVGWITVSSEFRFDRGRIQDRRGAPADWYGAPLWTGEWAGSVIRTSRQVRSAGSSMR